MADENQARHALADMQARISRSAYDALGITAGDVGPEHVRAAFLQLTKVFHPAKFARMSTDIQKLANEVFLGLRAAHDQLARAKPAQRQSGSIPVIPSKTPTNDLTRGTSGIRPNVPPPPTSSLNPPTQRGVSATAPAQRPVQPPQPRPPTTPAAPTTPPVRTGPTPATQPMRRMTPIGGVPAVTRPPTPAMGTARPPTAPVAATPAAGGAEPELAGVYDLLQKGQFEQARTTLNALIALQPRPRYRALLQYSIGREAQLARRLDEARVELGGALEIDPDLQLAKTALAELFTRRK